MRIKVDTILFESFERCLKFGNIDLTDVINMLELVEKYLKRYYDEGGYDYNVRDSAVGNKTLFMLLKNHLFEINTIMEVIEKERMTKDF